MTFHALVEDSTQDITYIDSKQLIKHPINKQRWETVQLPESQGNAEFSIGKISKDICFTRSRCAFHCDYHARIRYEEPTTLLIFGLVGCSAFGFANHNSNLHTIRAGDIWLISIDGNEELSRITPASQQNEMLVIKYAQDRLADAFSDEDGDKLMPMTKINRLGHQAQGDFGLSDLMNNALNTTTNRLLAESQALELLARWVAPDRQVVPANPQSGRQDLPASELASLQMVIETITSDLVNTPSLQQLAERAGMSHTKLNRCFKKMYGATVYNWLRNYRLERARYYLGHVDNNITTIAFQCGFSSASHLSYAFKQQYECTPLEYREKLLV